MFEQRRRHDGTEPSLLEVADQLRLDKLVDCIKRQVIIHVNIIIFSLSVNIIPSEFKY